MGICLHFRDFLIHFSIHRVAEYCLCNSIIVLYSYLQGDAVSIVRRHRIYSFNGGRHSIILCRNGNCLGRDASIAQIVITHHLERVRCIRCQLSHLIAQHIRYRCHLHRLFSLYLFHLEIGKITLCYICPVNSYTGSRNRIICYLYFRNSRVIYFITSGEILGTFIAACILCNSPYHIDTIRQHRSIPCIFDSIILC